MSATSDKVLATICSAIQYLVDRGEIEDVDEVLTSVRYTATVRVNHFDVRVGRKVIRIYAKELKSKPPKDEEKLDFSSAEYVHGDVKIPLKRLSDLGLSLPLKRADLNRLRGK